MRLFGLAGWSGSGKTTLIGKLLPELTRRGVTVSTVKHAHHEFDVDQPGKDSYQHRQAGAYEVLVSSVNRWALMHEHRGAPEASPEELAGRLSPVDLVLIEGFKAYPHDKIEIRRAADAGPFFYETDPHIVAIASETPIGGVSLPVLELDNIAAIADFIIRHCALEDVARGVA